LLIYSKVEEDIQMPVDSPYRDPETIAQVLNWDRFTNVYTPELIQRMALDCDILWYDLGAWGAIPISISQFDEYLKLSAQ
jgi:hypothetical protein